MRKNMMKKKALTGSRSPLEDLCTSSTLLWTLVLSVLLGSRQVCWGSKLWGFCLRLHFSAHPQKSAGFELGCCSLCFRLWFDICRSMRRQTALQRKYFINFPCGVKMAWLFTRRQYKWQPAVIFSNFSVPISKKLSLLLIRVIFSCSPWDWELNKIVGI